MTALDIHPTEPSLSVAGGSARGSLIAWDLFSLILPAVAIAPLLFLQCIFLWEKEHLQFFPLAFAAAGWFLYQGWPSPAVTDRGRSWTAFVAAFVAFLLAAAALLLNSPWLSQVTLIALIWAWAMGRLASLTPLRITGICGLMIVTVPVPAGGDQKLVQSLQSLSATASSRLMDVSGIVHLKRGNILEITSKPLFVEEACSGVDSQYALMTVAGVMLLVGRVGLVVSLITIITVPIWAIFGNLLRIYSIVIGLDWFAVDLSTGTAHTLLGLICFAAAAWVHWSSVQFLNFVQWRFFPSSVASTGIEFSSDPVRREAAIGPIADPAPMLSKGWLAVPAMLLLMFPVASLAVVQHYDKEVPRLTESIADRFPGESALPASIGTQRRVQFQNESRNIRNILGQHSRIWTYSGELGVQIVSLDLPFRGWHPLWECYINAGWRRLSTEEIRQAGDGSPLTFTFFETTLENDEGDFAVLHFSLFDENGAAFTYDGGFEPTPRGNRLSATVLAAMTRDARPRDPLTFQFQMLSKTEVPATPDQVTHFRNMYLQLRGPVHALSMPVVSELKGR